VSSQLSSRSSVEPKQGSWVVNEPVAAMLREATAAWHTDHDVEALRRALRDLLARLDEG
jgi:hypothetical protein